MATTDVSGDIWTCAIVVVTRQAANSRRRSAGIMAASELQFTKTWVYNAVIMDRGCPWARMPWWDSYMQTPGAREHMNVGAQSFKPYFNERTHLCQAQIIPGSIWPGDE